MQVTNFARRDTRSFCRARYEISSGIRPHQSDMVTTQYATTHAHTYRQNTLQSGVSTHATSVRLRFPVTWNQYFVAPPHVACLRRVLPMLLIQKFYISCPLTAILCCDAAPFAILHLHLQPSLWTLFPTANYTPLLCLMIFALTARLKGRIIITTRQTQWQDWMRVDGKSPFWC